VDPVVVVHACDRCDDAEAVVLVFCWYGCVHLQCEDCAAATAAERNGG
jgi:hypothetical protein